MRSTFLFTLTTLAAVAVIVACSPNNGKKTSVTPRSPNGFGEKVSSCTDSIRASEKLKVGSKNKVVVCEVAAGQTVAAPVEYPVSFSVQKDEKSSKSEVRLAMTVGFETRDTLAKEEREKLRLRFADVCGTSTQEIFSRSRVSIALRLNLNFVFPGDGDDGGDVFGDPSSAQDQTLLLSRGAKGKDIFWTLSQLPSKPDFYPNGLESDTKECAVKFPSSGDDQKKCAWQKRAVLNAPACAAFAKRVGNLFGIVDAEKEASVCGAVQPVVAKMVEAPQPAATPGAGSGADADADSGDVVVTEAKPQPTDPGESSSFAKPRVSDSEFLAKAELNRKDLLTILAPVCPDQLKDVK